MTVKQFLIRKRIGESYDLSRGSQIIYYKIRRAAEARSCA